MSNNYQRACRICGATFFPQALAQDICKICATPTHLNSVCIFTDEYESLQSKLKAATELAEKAKPHLKHSNTCNKEHWRFGSNIKCTCGLDDLRKQIEDVLGK